MLARLLTFVVWALVAASGVYWGLKLFVHAPSAPPQLTLAAAKPSAAADWSKLFGPDVAAAVAEAAPAPALDARFQLVGVVAPRRAGQGGVALIGVDGKPVKAYQIGSSVDGALVLQSVQRREAALGPAGGAPQVRLQMPAQPVAAMGAAPMPVNTAFGIPPAAAVMPTPMQAMPPPAGASAPRRRTGVPFGAGPAETR